MIKNNFQLGVIACAAISLLSGCTVAIQPIDRADLLQTLRLDRFTAQKEVEPLTSELTLEEAIARGVKYNLDHRVRMMERSVAMGQFDLSRYDMLPKMMANAGYSTRDKPNQNTNLPDSSDQNINTSGLSLSWNLLDFGMSYYTAKQNADRALVAAEKRRKAMHILIQDIQTTYWRAASAQKLRSETVEAIQIGDEALRDAVKVEKENLRKPLEVLRYQKNLLDNLRVLESIDQELSSAEIELVTLLNLPIGTNLKLKEPSFDLFIKGLDQVSTEDLEVLALTNNADIKESVYNSRIAVEETKKSLLKILPGISFNYGANYTSNSYTVNKNWMEGAGQINFNLFNLLTASKVIDQGDAEKELAEQRRMAMQMAILGQVHLAKQQLENAKRLYGRSENIAKVDDRIAKIAIASEKQGTLSKAELVSAQSSHIVSQLRKYQSLSQLYAASGRLQSTLGYEPNFGDIQTTSLKSLTASVGQSMSDWNSGNIIRQSIKTIDESVVTPISLNQEPVKVDLPKNVTLLESNRLKEDVKKESFFDSLFAKFKINPSTKSADLSLADKEKSGLEVDNKIINQPVQIAEINSVPLVSEKVELPPVEVKQAPTAVPLVSEKVELPPVEVKQAPLAVPLVSEKVELPAIVAEKPVQTVQVIESPKLIESVESPKVIIAPSKIHLESFKINQPAAKSLNDMSWTLPVDGVIWSASAVADYTVKGRMVWGAKTSTKRGIKVLWSVQNKVTTVQSVIEWNGEIPTNPSNQHWKELRIDALAHLSKSLALQNQSVETKKPELIADLDGAQPSIRERIEPMVVAEEISAGKLVKEQIEPTEPELLPRVKEQQTAVVIKEQIESYAPAKVYLESFKINQPAAKSLNDMSWSLPVEGVIWSQRSSADYKVNGKLIWGVKKTSTRAIKVVWHIQHGQTSEKSVAQWDGEIPNNPNRVTWQSVRVDALEVLSKALKDLQ